MVGLISIHIPIFMLAVPSKWQVFTLPSLGAGKRPVSPSPFSFLFLLS